MSKLFEALKRLETTSEAVETPGFGRLFSSPKSSGKRSLWWPILFLLLAIIMGLGVVYLVKWRLQVGFKPYQEQTRLDETRQNIPVPEGKMPAQPQEKGASLREGQKVALFQSQTQNEDLLFSLSPESSSALVCLLVEKENLEEDVAKAKAIEAKATKAQGPAAKSKPVARLLEPSEGKVKVSKKWKKQELAPSISSKKRPPSAQATKGKARLKKFVAQNDVALAHAHASRPLPNKGQDGERGAGTSDSVFHNQEALVVPENPFFSDRRWLLLAEEARAEGHYDRAVRLLERYVAHHSDPNVLNNLGGLYLLTGRYSKAIDVLSRALKRKEDPDIAYNLALAYLKAGKPEQSCLLLQRFSSPRLEGLAQAMNCSTLKGPRKEREVSRLGGRPSLRPR